MLTVTTSSGNLEIAIRLRKTHRWTIVYSKRRNATAMTKHNSTVSGLYYKAGDHDEDALSPKIFDSLIVLPLEAKAGGVLDPALFFKPQSAAFISQHPIDLSAEDKQTVQKRLKYIIRRHSPEGNTWNPSESEKLSHRLYSEALYPREGMKNGSLFSYSGWSRRKGMNVIFNSGYRDIPRSGGYETWGETKMFLSHAVSHMKVVVCSEHAEFPTGLLKEEALAIIACMDVRLKYNYRKGDMIVPVMLFSFTGSKWGRILIAVHDGKQLVVRKSLPMDCTGVSSSETWAFIGRYLAAKANTEPRTRFTTV